MKNNYKIKLNPTPLSSEQIAKHQDFDALLAQMQAKKGVPIPPRTAKVRPLYYIIGAAAAAALALVVFFTGNQSDYAIQSQEFFGNRDFIEPPLPAVQPQFASYRLNVNQGGTYTYKSGSTLTIPAAAFVDKQGNLIEGEIEIKYREFHDYVDFYMSGIPMTYDSAGTTYNLESAGMMEIYAEKDGRKVKMAPGKSIDVQLASEISAPAHLNVPPDYNIYKLDTKKRNWVYQDLDNMAWMDAAIATDFEEGDPRAQLYTNYRENLSEIEKERKATFAQIEAQYRTPQKPIAPKRATKEDHVFALDFNDLSEIIDNHSSADHSAATTKNELANLYRDYEQMLWQISPASNVSPQQFANQNSEADDIHIRKINNRDYEFTLIKGNATTKVIVNPVLTGKDYEKALNSHNQQLAAYEAAIEAQQQEKDAALQAATQRFEQAINTLNENYQQEIAITRSNHGSTNDVSKNVRRKVINKFQATGMGIWNCDRPIPPSEKDVIATFTDESGTPFKDNVGYLVDQSSNTIQRFFVSEETPLSFNQNSKNLLWLTTDDDKIAVFKPEDFKRINQPKGSQVFQLKVVDRKIEDESDIREILSF